jgi:hypothetical protein
MPLNGLSSGIDHKLTFTDVNGVQNFTIIENFTSKEDAVTDKLIAMDGTVRHPKFHQGWSGTFMLERNSDFMDAYIAVQEAAYYQGLDQVNLTIQETIQENDGTVSQYQYIQVVITLEDAGTYSGTEIVKQNVTFAASRKLQLV